MSVCTLVGPFTLQNHRTVKPKVIDASTHAKKWPWPQSYATLLAGSNQSSGHMACLMHTHMLMSYLTCLPQSCTNSKQQKQAKMIIEQLADMHSSLPHTATQGLQHAMQRKPMHCFSASIVPCSAGPHNMQVYLAHQHSHILFAKQIHLIFS